MGAKLSALKRAPAQEDADKASGAKFTKIASLKLGAAEASLAVGDDAQVAKIKELIQGAKTAMDEFSEFPAPCADSLAPAKEKIAAAKELVAKLSSTGVDVTELQSSLSAAEEALAQAITAAEQNEADMAKSNCTALAADSVAAGGRKLEKVVSGRGKSASLTKVTSDVKNAQEVLGGVAMNEVYGDGATAEELGAATVAVKSAIEGLEEEIKTAPADIIAELTDVKGEMQQAVASLQKRASFK